MLEKYITIEKDAEIEIVEKKSRFIAHVYQIESAEQAEDYLNQIRKKHWNANHNCYGYQLGERNEIQRFSDDGEPQGTAGKPILDVLKGKDIKNTLIVVTRYFGGTLLGTGGLVRAYGLAAKEGVMGAGLVERRRIKLFEIETDYTLLGKVQYLLNEKGYVIRDTLYLQTVTFVVEVLVGESEVFTKWLIDQTNAEVSIQEGESCLITCPIS